MFSSEDIRNLLRDIVKREYSRATGVVNIVIYVCDTVGLFYDNALKRGCHMVTRMVYDTVTHLKGKVKTLAVIFKLLDYA